MMKYIYSKFLEKKLINIGYKKISRLYRMCMPRYMKVYPYSSYQIASYTDDSELAKKNIIEQMVASEGYAPKVDLPYYYCDVRDGKYYIRHLMMTPSEDILAEIYSDRFLILL